MLFLEEGDWGKADDYCEQVLDAEPENSWAYTIKLMARLKVRNEEELKNVSISFAEWNSYRNACRYADDVLRERLESCLSSVEDKIRLREEKETAQAEVVRQEAEQRRNEAVYREACQLQRRNYEKAAQYFEQIAGYLDSEERAKDCRLRLAEQKEQEQQRERELQEAQNRAKKKKKTIATVALVLLIAVVVYAMSVVNATNTERAQRIEQQLIGRNFAGTYDVYGGRIGNPDSWGIYQEMTQYEVVYCFREDGAINVDTVKRYDGYPFITIDGKLMWDSQTQYSETVFGGNVHVSLFGKVMVSIDGISYELTVDKNDSPISIIIDGTEYRCG